MAESQRAPEGDETLPDTPSARARLLIPSCSAPDACRIRHVAVGRRIPALEPGSCRVLGFGPAPFAPSLTSARTGPAERAVIRSPPEEAYCTTATRYVVSALGHPAGSGCDSGCSPCPSRPAAARTGTLQQNRAHGPRARRRDRRARRADRLRRHPLLARHAVTRGGPPSAQRTAGSSDSPTRSSGSPVPPSRRAPWRCTSRRTSRRWTRSSAPPTSATSSPSSAWCAPSAAVTETSCAPSRPPSRNWRTEAETLAVDERTAEKLVSTCKIELGTIRARLDERRAALAGVHSDIRRLAAATTLHLPSLCPPSSRHRRAAAATPGPARGGRSSGARPRAVASAPAACTGS